LKLYPATPLEIRATLGSQKIPLRDAFVQISRSVNSEWLDAAGERREGRYEIRHWIKTDAEGYIRTGLGRGSHVVTILDEKWQQEQKLAVDSDQPLSVRFHKPYEGKREIQGQLAILPVREASFADAKVVAVESPGKKVVDLGANANGEFLFSTDCPQVTFFATDKESDFCGTVIATETNNKVAIDLKPAASYEGKFVDAQGAPIAGALLTLSIQAAPAVFTNQTRTDGSGRFHFEHVFVEVPLRISVQSNDRPEVLAEHYFEAGEQRRGIELRSKSINRREQRAAHVPLQQRINVAALDARLAAMHVLVIVGTGDGQSQQFIQCYVLDGEEVPSIYEYQPVAMTAEELDGQADDLAIAEEKKWPLPAKEQITLAALDGQGKTLGSTQVATDAPTARDQVREFLSRHQPKVPAAGKLWQEALADAKSTNRRVLLQFGGPRCGPCFRFSRWTDEHHQVLDRDFILLKLHSGRHSGALEIEARLRGKPGGIPWTAILDADGKVLITSDGPLGNIGFPDEFEGARHFRRMLERTAQRLSEAEIAALLATLGD
jgi:hypothetical protein